MIEDIRRRKAAEARVQELHAQLEERVRDLEAANTELEAFSASVSHDLRAPLLTVAQFSHELETTLQGALEESHAGMLRRIGRAGLQAKRIVDDLRELSEVNRRDLHLERVDLSALVTELAEELRALSPERRVRLVVEPDVGAMGDCTLLRVLLANLLQNAWKYTGRREHARIEFGADVGALRTRYFVVDDGIGFAHEHRDRIFEPFERLHTTDEFAGTGLGLSTARRIVERHGGQIWGESSPGAGAAFSFTLFDPVA